MMDANNDTQGGGMKENPPPKQFTSYPDGAVTTRSHSCAPVFSRAARLLALALPLLFGLLGVSPAHAGKYELAKFWYTGIRSNTAGVQASDLPLCKAFVENLNSFPERKEPMVCERPLHPKFNDFGRPEWKALDPMKHLDLLVQGAALAPYTKTENAKKTKEELAAWEKSAREGIKANIGQGEIKLSLARLDLVGPASRPDGKAENVLRVEVGHCDPKKIENPTYRRGFVYYVANDDLTEVKTEFAGSIRGLDPFLYHGKVYFDAFTVANMPDPDLPPKQRAARVGADQHEIYIYRPIEDGVARFCRIRYID